MRTFTRVLLYTVLNGECVGMRTVKTFTGVLLYTVVNRESVGM